MDNVVHEELNKSENQYSTPEQKETSINTEEQQQNHSKNATSSTDEISVLELAKLLGENYQAMFLIKRGYYWSPDENRVIAEPDAEGETPPPPSRTTRRRLQRKAQQLRQEQNAIEEKRWSRLYRKLRKQPAASANEDASSSYVYDEQISALLQASGDCNEVEHVKESVSETVEEKVEDSNEEVDTIHNVLLDLGTNGILRFFTWVIKRIAQKILADPNLRQKYLTKESAFTRDRKILLESLFTFLLTMGGDNMNHEVYEYFKMTPVHPSSPAMVNRRKLLKPEGVEYFMNEITVICESICSYLPKDKTRSQIASEFNAIYAGDGSGINVAYNSENEDTYVKGTTGQRGYNQYHLNCIRDDISGLISASVLQTISRLNETGAAAEMIQRLNLHGISLFMGDRGYGSLNLIETIRRKENLECLIRVKEGWINETRNLPLEELDQVMTIHVVTTQRNEDKVRFNNGTAKYLSGKSKFGKNKTSQTWNYESEVDVSFRVVRFRLDSGAWETLVTTLDREVYPLESLKELYFMRWSNIENAFRVLKWDNHLSQMHCRRDDFSRQEIFARIAMYNIVSCVIRIAECAEASIEMMKHAIDEDSEVKSENRVRKHESLINRSFATHLICDFLRNPDSINFDMIEMILRFKVPVRKGRSYRRNLRTIPFVSFSYR